MWIISNLRESATVVVPPRLSHRPPRGANYRFETERRYLCCFFYYDSPFFSHSSLFFCEHTWCLLFKIRGWLDRCRNYEPNLISFFMRGYLVFSHSFLCLSNCMILQHLGIRSNRWELSSGVGKSGQARYLGSLGRLQNIVHELQHT